MKNLLMVGLVFSAISASAGEILKCKLITQSQKFGGSPMTSKTTNFEYDVDAGTTNVKLVKFTGEEDYKIFVNVFKTVVDPSYTLEANFDKNGERAILGRANSPSLPLTVQMGMINVQTHQDNWISLTCGI